MTQLRTGLRWGLGLLVAVGLLGMPGGIVAQPAPGGVMAPEATMPPGEAVPALLPPGAEPRTFGTSSLVAHTIQAFAFHPSPAAARLRGRR